MISLIYTNEKYRLLDRQQNFGQTMIMDMHPYQCIEIRKSRADVKHLEWKGLESTLNEPSM